MAKHPVLVDVSIPVQKAAMLMAEHDTGSVIVTKNNYPVGILTERDLARKIVTTNASQETLTEDVMSSPLYYSSPDADILEVTAAMNINEIKKIPILKGHTVVGVITQTDIIQHLFSVFKQMHRAYQKGQISPKEFADKSSDIVKNLEQAALQQANKNWHMTCEDCGYTFLNPESEKGLRYNQCPSCRSQNISYRET